MPQRVKLSRAKGWRMPPHTLKVDRTTRWGNPYTPAESGSMTEAVQRHARWMRGELPAPDGKPPPTQDEIRAALGGHNLACWCPLDGPCHADLLLKLANDR
ncbi:MAG TPA: DUF4326 domain-containing protein [Caldimonas sp.]|nr:DUF4326 domain-containing protein [Caldimonas sp.]